MFKEGNVKMWKLIGIIFELFYLMNVLLLFWLVLCNWNDVVCIFRNLIGVVYSCRVDECDNGGEEII